MAAPGKPQSVESGWNSPQRRALLLLISLLLLVLIVQLILNRRYVPQHPAQGGRAAELASRLDPNTADWQALAAIPNLGEKRARDIVSFRERIRASPPGQVVYKKASDLRVIRGIGPATIERLGAYLIFPGERPAS